MSAPFGIRQYTGLGASGAPAWGAQRAAAENVAYKNTPYPSGVAGVRMSLTEMARLMREARNDHGVNGYAADVLKAAGIDGRNRSTWRVRAIVQAFLDNVRAVMIYSPDPTGTEMITSPAGQLCLRPGLCIRKEDCDGLSTLLGALCLCVGLQVRIVKQSWGAGQQEHVLVAVLDEQNEWLKADPSHASLPVGQGVPANEEQMYDPLDAVGAIGTSGPELVTFGALPPQQAASQTVRQAPAVRPRTQINDQLMPRPAGVGRAPAAVGLGLVTPGDILAYRAAWNQYVLDTVGSANACAASYDLLADENTTDAATAATLRQISTDTQGEAAALNAQWNVYANTELSTIVLQGSAILQSFQQTVLAAGKLRNSITTGTLTCPLRYPNANATGFIDAAPGVDPSVQAQIIARIEGLGILAGGILEILVGATGNGLVAAGSAASWIAQHGANAAEKLSWLTSPWTWGIIGGVVVLGGIAYIKTEGDIARLATVRR